MFSHVYLLVFRNGHEISDDTVFLSSVLKNLILIIKHNWKANFHVFNRIIYIHLSSKTPFIKSFFSVRKFKEMH